MKLHAIKWRICEVTPSAIALAAIIVSIFSFCRNVFRPCLLDTIPQACFFLSLDTDFSKTGNTFGIMYSEVFLSRIRILHDKIQKVISDIRDINNKAKLRETKTHKYMASPNTYHNSGRTLLSGENHHPRLDSLVSEEDPADSSPDSSTSDACSTLTVGTSDLSSSPSEIGGRYAQSDPPPEMTTDSPVEEERGEIKDELVSPLEQGSRGGT